MKFRLTLLLFTSEMHCKNVKNGMMKKWYLIPTKALTQNEFYCSQRQKIRNMYDVDWFLTVPWSWWQQNCIKCKRKNWNHKHKRAFINVFMILYSLIKISSHFVCFLLKCYKIPSFGKLIEIELLLSNGHCIIQCNNSY